MISNDHTPAPEGEELTYVLEAAPRAADDISPKVSGGLAAGAVATLTVFVASQLGLDIPPGVEGAIAVLVGYAASYFIRDTR